MQSQSQGIYCSIILFDTEKSIQEAKNLNVLILGKSEINPETEHYLSIEGFNVTVVEDVSAILRFRGEPGNFKVTTATGVLDCTAVVITEPPLFDSVVIDGGKTINFLKSATYERVADPKESEKIVLLLDFEEETPEYIQATAISCAMWLAKKKKDVLYLSKTVKSGYGGGELTYSEARNSGVSFIKYENVSPVYDTEADIFDISIYDGVFTRNVSTTLLLTAVSRETPELRAIMKKLRLYAPGIDKFYLYSAFTTRRGIYYLNPALFLPDAGFADQALRSISEDIAAMKTDGYLRETVREREFPEIDPNKCAFCYSCYRACPHGALEPDHISSAMKIVEAACQACGKCIAICPGSAIARKRSHDNGPAESDPGRYKIYCCENGAAEAFEETMPFLSKYTQVIDHESVACGGNIGADMLAGDFKNYDKVIVACCMESACRHIDGDKHACKQVERTADLLNKAGLENKGVYVVKASHAMKNVLRDNIINILEGQR